MLEYVKAGRGARLSFAVLHEDPTPQYAYGPAQGMHVGVTLQPGDVRHREEAELDDRQHEERLETHLCV